MSSSDDDRVEPGSAGRDQAGSEESPSGADEPTRNADEPTRSAEESVDYTVIPARRRPRHSPRHRAAKPGHRAAKPGHAPAKTGRAWVYGAAGVAVAVLLAVVLFAGLGTGGTVAPGRHKATPSMEAQSTQGELAPGINPSTSLLLSLTVFPHSSHPTAPDFQLTDQSGRPVSMNQFRGKVVMFAANDDQCTDLCTFLANDIVLANHDLGPAAKNVVWLSVNANPFYPKVSTVKAWTDEHGLGNQPNWHFGTSTPTVLKQVWKKYGVQVQLDHKNRTVVHGTELFVVDPSGHERAAMEFGAEAASTALFAHGMAQVANDFLPASQRVHVKGPLAPAPTAKNATVGANSPSLSLPYLQGGKGTLHLRDLRGKYVVLNFWSSTCTVCRTELPNLESVYKFAKSSVDFVGVDVSDRAHAARAMATHAHVTYPLVSDPNGTAAGTEQVTGLPYTLILNAKGTILIRHPGALTAEQLKYLLENYAASPMG